MKFILAFICLINTCLFAFPQNKDIVNTGINNNMGSAFASDSTKINRGKDNFKDFGSSDNKSKNDTIQNYSILDLLGIIDKSRSSYSWFLNKNTYNLEEKPYFDTILFQPHLICPYQKDLIPFNGLGNLGAPVQSVSFFNRDFEQSFLFSKNYKVYQKETLSRVHFNVKSPHTILKYSSGGKSNEAELSLGVMHTQNVNPYLNFGLEFNYYNSKGMYLDQLTRDNDFSAFASYYKNRLFAQFTVNTSRIRNQENGGVKDEHYITDTVMESRLVPMMLEGATSEVKRRSFSLLAGYNIVEKKSRFKNLKNEDSIIVRPIITSKLIFEFDKNTRKYSDNENDSSFYGNFYIYPTATNDSVMLATYSTTALVEINQIAKYPGVPGLRAWLTNTSGKYSMFEMDNYLFQHKDKHITTNHLGLGVYSKSAYLNYSGALRLYLNGYRASDKEIFGEISLLPWKSKDLPYVNGYVSITDLEPDIFIKNYYSNHYRWKTNFSKQQTFRIGAELGADKWRTWVGYNMARLTNYIYFNEDGMPAQAADGVTVTSASIRNYLRVGWFWWLNNLIWQNSSNEDVLSLPKISLYSSVYVQHYIVKDVLTVQFGISAFFNSAYYADGYIPATGQFYSQRKSLIGDYPLADVFLNMKWKQAILFLKYEHINKGYPNNEFFVGYRYPANQQAFKFGLSWMFYN